MSNIQSFYSTAQKHDYARIFQFQVIAFGNVTLNPKHALYIETASLPGRTINNIAVPYMGLNFNVPGTASYPGSDSWQVQLRCDERYDIRDALERSTFTTFDDRDTTGDYGTPRAEHTVIMQLLNKKNAPIRTYTLFGAWVKEVAAANYDIKDNGAIQTISCTLAYQFWRVNNNSTATQGTTHQNGFSSKSAVGGKTSPTQWN